MPIIIYILLVIQRTLHFAWCALTFQPLRGPKAYTIKAGDHYHKGYLGSFRPVVGKSMKFTLTFDSSCEYETNNPTNQWDINKAWGFREGISGRNSARIGWNWKEEALWVYPYTHVDKMISIDPPGVQVKPGEPISCEITVSDFKYIFTINRNQIVVPRGSNESRFYGLQEYPYFGGDEVAPHNIKILIEPK